MDAFLKQHILIMVLAHSTPLRPSLPPLSGFTLFISLIRKEQASRRQQSNMTEYNKIKTITSGLDRITQQKERDSQQAQESDTLIYMLRSPIKLLSQEL